MPEIGGDYSQSRAEIDKLVALHKNTESIAAEYQKLVAEISLLRLFDLLENTFKVLTCKLLCGSNYLDGSSALLLVRCRSLRTALEEMETSGRGRHHYLKWSRVSEIKENVRYVLDPADHLLRVFDRHGVLVDELRRIRNRVAHNNPKSRAMYREVVRRHYGAYVNTITPGTLLLSPRRSPPLMEQYLTKSRIVLKELVKA